MSGYVVVSPQDETELESVYDFFARSFQPDYFTAKKRFDFLRVTEPYSPLHNHLIVKESNDVVGALRLVDRELMFGEVRLSAAGMSTFAVHPDYWFKGVAQAIQKRFFDLADHTFDLTFGFARKRLDGYWSRFGYIGYTSFTTLAVQTHDLSSTDAGCSLVEFSDESLPSCQQYYADNYQDVFGSVYRDTALWDFYLKRIRWSGLGNLQIFVAQDGRPVGYALINKDRVMEVAGAREAYMGMVNALKVKLGKDFPTLQFELSPAHPFFRFLLRFNHTYAVRRVWNGGHIAKTGPVSKFLAKIRPTMETRLREADCRPMLVRINNQNFDWTGTSLDISCIQDEEPGDVEFEVREWQKVLLGVVPPNDVKGFRAASKQAERFVHTLFPVLWPQTPELDRF